MILHKQILLKTSIFAHQDQDGYNCLISVFDLMTQYFIRNNKNRPSASTGLFTEIEATVEYLIQLGDKHNLNMTQILNHKIKKGLTLFYKAAFYSEKVAKILIQRNVKVNTVDDTFLTPNFKVSNRFLIILIYF